MNPRIENWSIADAYPDPYQPPELQRKILQGNVYGHSRFDDGEHIYTSCIVKHDYKAGWVQTRNTLYELGRIDPDYIEYMKSAGIKPETFSPEDLK